MPVAQPAKSNQDFFGFAAKVSTENFHAPTRLPPQVSPISSNQPHPSVQLSPRSCRKFVGWRILRNNDIPLAGALVGWRPREGVETLRTASQCEQRAGEGIAQRTAKGAQPVQPFDSGTPPIRRSRRYRDLCWLAVSGSGKTK
jgi:hypothetical protein